MSHAFRSTVCAAALIAAGLSLLPAVGYSCAQGPQDMGIREITGTWQGLLDLQPPIRIVFKINRQSATTFGAQVYSVDQSSTPIQAGSVTVHGKKIKIEVPSLGSLDGNMADDGASIVAQVSVSGLRLPLTLVRPTPATAFLPADAVAPAVSRATASRFPVLDVASVKPSNPGVTAKGFAILPRRLRTINTTVVEMIAYAYSVHSKQVSTALAWANHQKFDLTMQVEGAEQPSEEQWRLLLRTLLAEHYGLSFHEEQREVPSYLLLLAHSTKTTQRNPGSPSGTARFLFSRPGVLHANDATLADFARIMQSMVLDRAVLDQTDQAGRFNFTLNWTPDQSQFNGMVTAAMVNQQDAGAPPGLFTAMEEQIGLKLESRKALVKVFVIDGLSEATDL